MSSDKSILREGWVSVNLKSRKEEKRAKELKETISISRHVNGEIYYKLSCGETVEIFEPTAPRKHPNEDLYYYEFIVKMSNIIFENQMKWKIPAINRMIDGFVRSLYSESANGKHVISQVNLERYSCPEFNENGNLAGQVMKNDIMVMVSAGNDAQGKVGMPHLFKTINVVSNINGIILSQMKPGLKNWNSTDFLSVLRENMFKSKRINVGFPKYFPFDFPSDIKDEIEKEFSVKKILERDEWDKDGWYLFYDLN